METKEVVSVGTSSLIWSVADLLRGDFKQSDYGKVILPFTVLRRLDCVLEKTKPDVLAELAANKNLPPEALDRFLVRKAGYQFYVIDKCRHSDRG